VNSRKCSNTFDSPEKFPYYCLKYGDIAHIITWLILGVRMEKGPAEINGNHLQ
jgi:hypothetical protein